VDGEVSEDTSGSSSEKKITYGEFFREWFPFYKNCGMTYDQYWFDDPSLVIDYFRAYILARDEKNYFAWLNGFYNFVAFSDALSNFGAGLAGKRGNSNYMTEPIKIRPQTEEEIEAENEMKRKKFVAALNRFHARMEAKKNAG